MVWVDQPIGTGFSPAAPGAPAEINNEVDIASRFSGFWKNFMETFDLTGRKVYIAGESYAGQYIPYIADYMLNQSNTDYYNVQGIQINDPSINYDDTLIQGKVFIQTRLPYLANLCSSCCLGFECVRQHFQSQRNYHDRRQ